MKFYFLGLFLLSSLHLFAQSTTEMLDALERELFPEKTQQIYLYELINCESHKIDSTILVRAAQPDVYKVFHVLEKIMYNQQDLELFARLQNIYNRHVQNFMEEWARAYSDNFYACEPIQNQFNVLKGFEVTIRSVELKINNYMANEIFELYIQDMNHSQAIWTNNNIPERKKLIDECETFSKEYKELNRKAWFGGTVPFHYLDPYLKELKPYFVEYLFQCNWNESFHPSDCMIVINSKRFYNQLKDQKIIDYMIGNYEIWHEHHKSAFIFNYAIQQFDERLSKFLVSWWIGEEDKPDRVQNYQKGWVGLLIDHGNNWDVVLEALIELAKEDFEKSVRMTKYLPREDALVRLEEFSMESGNVVLVQKLMDRISNPNKEK